MIIPSALIIAEWTYEQTLDFWLKLIGAIGLILTSIATTFIMARVKQSIEVSQENARKIDTNTLATLQAKEDVVGHVAQVGKDVNGHVEKFVKEAKLASFAEGALDEKNRAGDIETARRLGESDARIAQSPVAPPPPLPVTVVNPPSTPIPVTESNPQTKPQE